MKIFFVATLCAVFGVYSVVGNPMKNIDANELAKVIADAVVKAQLKDNVVDKVDGDVAVENDVMDIDAEGPNMIIEDSVAETLPVTANEDKTINNVADQMLDDVQAENDVMDIDTERPNMIIAESVAEPVPSTANDDKTINQGHDDVQAENEIMDINPESSNIITADDVDVDENLLIPANDDNAIDYVVDKVVDDVKATNTWQLQGKNVCFGARGNKYGTFRMKQEGKLIGLKLVHRTGYVACYAHGDSFWGCKHSRVDLGVYITDKNNRQIFPKYATYPTYAAWLKRAWYYLPGFNAFSKTLVFTDISTPMYAFVGEEVRVWYGEDRVDATESDNHGVTCADMYAQVS